jgi:polyhydroxybutyrate depolymerase
VIAAVFAYQFAREFGEPPLAGALHREMLTLGPLRRTFAFYLPDRVGAQPPLLFVLHGSNGDGATMRRMTAFRFDQLADQKGIVVVYPDGYKKFWNDCRKSADYAANVEDIDDPAFFAAMIDYFVQHYGIDASRVYALGGSNGGHMVYRLGLEMPYRFAALAAAAANLPVDSNLDCQRSGQPVSMAILNGTNDPINPYNGGLVTILGNSSRGEVRSSAATTGYWAQLAAAIQVENKRMPELDGNPNTWIEREIWRGADDVEIRLYTLHGSGHVLPAPPSWLSTLLYKPLGGAAGDMQSTTELWDFFDRHRAAQLQ